MKIQKGQLFINGIKLVSFYSKAMHHGMDEQEFKQSKEEMADNCNDACYKGLLEEVYHENLNEIAVPNDQVYVIGDDWARSNDSRLFGPLPMANVKGKMIGVEGKKVNRSTLLTCR